MECLCYGWRVNVPWIICWKFCPRGHPVAAYNVLVLTNLECTLRNCSLRISIWLLISSISSSKRILYRWCGTFQLQCLLIGPSLTYLRKIVLTASLKYRIRSQFFFLRYDFVLNLRFSIKLMTIKIHLMILIKINQHFACFRFVLVDEWNTFFNVELIVAFATFINFWQQTYAFFQIMCENHIIFGLLKCVHGILWIKRISKKQS